MQNKIIEMKNKENKYLLELIKEILDNENNNSLNEEIKLLIRSKTKQEIDIYLNELTTKVKNVVVRLSRLPNIFTHTSYLHNYISGISSGKSSLLFSTGVVAAELSAGTNLGAPLPVLPAFSDLPPSN